MSRLTENSQNAKIPRDDGCPPALIPAPQLLCKPESLGYTVCELHGGLLATGGAPEDPRHVASHHHLPSLLTQAPGPERWPKRLVRRSSSWKRASLCPRSQGETGMGGSKSLLH